MARLMKKASRRGVVLIEAALALPMLLLLTFGMIEYGWLFLQHQQITHAARRGARVGITIDATTAQVQTAIATYMDSAGLGGSGYAVTIAPADISTLDKGQVLTVSVEVSYENIRLGMPLVPLPSDLRSTVRMASEG